ENKYAGDLEAICGGAPGESEYVDSQYTMRSPLTVLAAARGLPVEICAGVHDGHTGSVPVSHTLRGFNMLAEANGMPEKKLSPDEIDYFVTREKTPPGLAGELPEDPAYESNPVLFRREAGPARVTVFEGGHQILPAAALQWLSTHSKGRL
ncbi:MAG: hypothetical protein U9N45_06040, partial [Gemmatimonadota bacterium]|nr:hypothetical protein [Gemmatimonadota bacterium]